MRAGEDAVRERLIERLIRSGDVSQHGKVIEVLYDPITAEFYGPGGCWFCRHPERSWLATPNVQLHEPDCPWIEAMELLGHEHPGHVTATE